jgi:archaellum component FlaC
MADKSQVEIRVKQLENDRDAMYEMIGDIQKKQAEQTRRFEGVDQRLDAMDQRFDRAGQQLDAIYRRLGGIDGRLGGIDGRFGGIDGRLGGIGTTLAEVVRRLPGSS